MKTHLLLTLPVLLTLPFGSAPSAPASPGGQPAAGSGEGTREGGVALCAANVRDQTSGECIPADSTPTLGALYPLSETLNVNNGGRVGVGTTSSSGKLHVEGGGLGGVLGVSGSSIGVKGVATSSFGVWGETQGSGVAGVYGRYSPTTGTTPGVLGETKSASPLAVGVEGLVQRASPGASSAGVRGINNGTGAFGIGVWGSHAGSGWGVLGAASGNGIGVRGSAPSGGTAVFASGDLTVTGTKAFAQPHPTDPSKEIRFACLEGNESGTYFRGTARLSGGRAVIPVPEDFRMASEAGGVTVQVTPRGDARLWLEETSLERIVVRGEGDVAFDYFANGVRRGFAGHETIRTNSSFVPKVRGEPFGEELPPAARAILVENGTLRFDFTPDEGTAARLGWELADLPADQVR